MSETVNNATAEKSYELGVNAAGETAAQVANYLLADLRVRFRGDNGGQLLCDGLQDSIIAACKESARTALSTARREHAEVVAAIDRLSKRCGFLVCTDRVQVLDTIGNKVERLERERNEARRRLVKLHSAVFGSQPGDEPDVYALDYDDLSALCGETNPDTPLASLPRAAPPEKGGMPTCPTCLGLHLPDDPDACAEQYPPENAAKGETQRGGVEG
jgi:hypothetical protein